LGAGMENNLIGIEQGIELDKDGMSWAKGNGIN
jgi:hypothetical protein